MPVDPQKLLAWPFEDLVHTYTTRDSILYALGVGAGTDPMDEADLRFVYEDGMLALPTMAVVLGYPGFWLKEQNTGADWRQVLHGEQGLVIHKPLPPAATVIGRMKITGFIDKGAGKGALLLSERAVIDQKSGELLATVSSTSFLRGDGGTGFSTGPAPAPHALPERAPDASLDLPTAPGQALIYRLSGDFNPLHADPKVAQGAGFPRPILHGLCTYGVAGRALLKLACDDDPARLKRMDLRFSAPVFPGETIRTEIWREGGGKVSFRAKVLERDLVVLNNGYAEIG
jgi:acyl dehydratase